MPPGPTFRKVYCPGCGSLRGSQPKCDTGRKEEDARTPGTEGRLCAASEWKLLTRGSAGFQMDFLSFIFLSKGLITSRSPDCM